MQSQISAYDHDCLSFYYWLTNSESAEDHRWVSWLACPRITTRCTVWLISEQVLLPCKITYKIFALAPLYFIQQQWWSANLSASEGKQLRSGAIAHPMHLWLLLRRRKQVNSIIVIIINMIITLDKKQRWRIWNTHYLTSVFWCQRKMEAADLSIMGRHKHNALTAISRYRGVKNANPKDYIFDQALQWGYGTNIFCENDLFLAQSVLEVEVYSEQGVKDAQN